MRNNETRIFLVNENQRRDESEFSVRGRGRKERRVEKTDNSHEACSMLERQKATGLVVRSEKRRERSKRTERAREEERISGMLHNPINNESGFLSSFLLPDQGRVTGEKGAFALALTLQMEQNGMCRERKSTGEGE